MPEDACAVDVRYLYQLIRTAPPAVVFAQAKLGFALAASGGDAPGGYAGINIVAPEDDPVAVRDDALHMRIIAYFHRRYPAVHIALHAGELTPLLAAPDALRDHIRSAVDVGAAERIGHGVDVLGERDVPQLLAELARRDVLVEICLTSNDVILGVRGAAHPLRAYLAASVPVALATDDPGVSVSSLTNEYLRAVTTYGFDYRTIKGFAYAGIRHAFVSPAQRAELERRLNAAFAAFEAREAHNP
jgi:adenosine deaminase